MDEYVLDEEIQSRDLTVRAEAEFAEGEDANASPTPTRWPR
jgi:hypothetical protein